MSETTVERPGWIVWGPMDAVCRRCASSDDEVLARYPDWVSLVELTAEEAEGIECSWCGRPLAG